MIPFIAEYGNPWYTALKRAPEPRGKASGFNPVVTSNIRFDRAYMRKYTHDVKRKAVLTILDIDTQQLSLTVD